MAKLRKIFAAAVLGTASLVSGNAIAADSNDDAGFKKDNLSFTIPLASRHIQERQFNTWDTPSVKKDFNEVNPGLIINYKLDGLSNDKVDTNISVGAYKNSFYETTYISSISVESKKSKFTTRSKSAGISKFMGSKISFGVEAGLTHGYKDPSGKKFPVLPMGQIFVTAEMTKELSLKVGLIPMTAVKSLLPDESLAVDVVTASVVWKPKFGK